jgi:hypothetical protein
MTDLVGSLAALSCTLFAGAALYVSLVEHPARLECGPEIAARQFAPSYRRATVMQVALAIVSASAGALRWIEGAGLSWLCGAVCIVAVIPYTLVAILPTNNRILDPQRDLKSAETGALLATWGRLHAVRTVMSLVAAILFLWGLQGSQP